MNGPYARCIHCGKALFLTKRFGQDEETWWHLNPGEAKCGRPEVVSVNSPLFGVFQGGKDVPETQHQPD